MSFLDNDDLLSIFLKDTGFGLKAFSPSHLSPPSEIRQEIFVSAVKRAQTITSDRFRGMEGGADLSSADSEGGTVYGVYGTVRRSRSEPGALPAATAAAAAAGCTDVTPT